MQTMRDFCFDETMLFTVWLSERTRAKIERVLNEESWGIFRDNDGKRIENTTMTDRVRAQAALSKLLDIKDAMQTMEAE